MFNKPDVFGRRDSTPAANPANSNAARRDAVPVLNSGTNAASAERSAAPKGAAAGVNAGSAPASSDPAPAATAPVTRDAGLGESDTGARLLVGPDVKLKGAEILDCDTLVVEGRVEATMDSRLLRIAANGSFAGKVSIDIAEIYGTFEGELTARSQLVIHSTGRVSGTIRFGKLVVDEGGELNGDISVLSAKAPATPIAQSARPAPDPALARSIG